MLYKKPIITTETPELLPVEFQGWYALKYSTGEFFEFVDGTWVVTKTLSYVGHSHPTHGDINFIGDVSADGNEGITGEYEGTFKKIVITKGIITEFELE